MLGLHFGPYIKAILTGIAAAVIALVVTLIGFLLEMYVFDYENFIAYDIINLAWSMINLLSVFTYMTLSLLAGALMAFLLRKGGSLISIFKASALSGLVVGISYLASNVLLYDITRYIIKTVAIYDFSSIMVSVLHKILFSSELIGMALLGAFIVALFINPEKKAGDGTIE